MVWRSVPLQWLVVCRAMKPIRPTAGPMNRKDLISAYLGRLNLNVLSVEQEMLLDGMLRRYEREYSLMVLG